MALWFDLRANTTHIGRLEIRRKGYLDVTVPEAANTISTYEVKLDGKLVGEVDHRYGNGPWALVQKAATLVAFHPSIEHPRDTPA